MSWSTQSLLLKLVWIEIDRPAGWRLQSLTMCLLLLCLSWRPSLTLYQVPMSQHCC